MPLSHRESKSWGSQWVNQSTFGSFSRRRQTSTALFQRIPMVPTGGLVALVHVRINQSQFLVERGPTRMDFDFRRNPRCTRVGMPQTESELSRRRISTSHCFVTVLPRGVGAHQRRQDQRGSPLGQLGRLHENGAPDTQQWLTPWLRGL